MNVYASVKFTNFTREGQAMSVGAVIEQEGEPLKVVYYELLGVDMSKASEFVKQYDATMLRLSGLTLDKNVGIMIGRGILPDNTDVNIAYHQLSKEVAGIRLYENTFGRLKEGETVQFHVDCGHYSIVFLNDLLATAVETNSTHIRTYHDVNNDIAKFFTNGNTEEAFDISREDMIRNIKGIDFYQSVPRYHALYDSILTYMVSGLMKQFV